MADGSVVQQKEDEIRPVIEKGDVVGPFVFPPFIYPDGTQSQ